MEAQTPRSNAEPEHVVREADALLAIMQATASTLEVKEILREVCRRAALVCGADRCTVFLWDEKTARIVPSMSQFASGEAQDALWRRFKGTGVRTLGEMPFIRRLVETRQPVAIENARGSPLIEQSWVEGFQLKSVLGVPLAASEQVVGALILDTTQAVRPFTARQVDLAVSICNQVGLFIQKAVLFAEMEGRLRQTEALLEIARALGSTLELKPLLKQIARHTALACDMDRCTVYLVEGERVVPVMSQFADGRVDRGLWEAFQRLRETGLEGIPFLAETIRRRTPVVIDHPEADPLVPPSLAVFQFKAVLVLPLVRQEKVVGALVLDNTQREQRVKPAQVALATTVASQVALAIENARLHEAEVRRGEQLGALLRATRAVMSKLDLKAILDCIIDEAARATGTPHVQVIVLDKEAQVLRVGASADAAVSSDVQLPVDTSLSGTVAKTGAPLFVADLRDDPRRIPTDSIHPPELVTYLGLPLKVRDEVLGVLTISTTDPRRYTDDELAYLMSFADQAAVALEHARLYQETQRALADLKVAQNQLVQSEKFRALGEMAGGVAHDFNNLLAAILGRTQHVLMQLEEREVTPKELRRNLGVVERAALDGAQTVRRLLEFTRATPAQDEMTAVDINELLAQTVEVSEHRWKAEAEAQGRAIEVVIEPGDVPPVAGNGAELREVLLSLVVNAIEAMPEGGTLTLSSRAEGGTICVSVKDTGVGMSPEVQRRIFDPFFTTKGPQTSGLGLSVAYGIVHRHKGEITVESQEGKGSTFQCQASRRTATASAGRAG